MSLARRLGRLEDERLGEAIAAFAAWWRAWAMDDSRRAHVRARLREAGYDGHEDDVAALERWHDAQPPEHRRAHDILERAILGMVERPAEQGAIRVALAALAPHLERSPADAPLVVIHTLRAMIETDDYPGE